MVGGGSNWVYGTPDDYCHNHTNTFCNRNNLGELSMKQHKTVPYVREVCTQLICDGCGKEAEDPSNGNWDTYGHWTNGELTYSSHFYEDHDYQRFDLCGPCASKLIEMVESGLSNWKFIKEQ